MVAAALLAIVLTPTRLTAATAPKIDLETMIPKQFGDWHQLEELDVIAVNPEVQANLDKVYQQTLSRTFINSKGEQIMLSLAYGGDQSASLHVHRPDICYSAQGFQVTHLTNDVIQTYAGKIPVIHMLATQNSRIEPITYWITVGDTVVRGGWEQRLAEIKYGLTGKVPDGILVRVSNISTDAPRSYKLHSNFINYMLDAMRKSDRLRLIGELTLSQSR
jgi:EpsI family protein